MTRRSGRSDTLADSAALLATLAACRRECIRAQACLSINGDLYKAITLYRAMLDDLAGHLTGDREAFWNKSRKY